MKQAILFQLILNLLNTRQVLHEILSINCEVDFILTWSKNCVLADMTVRDAGNNNDPPAISVPTGLESQIKDLYLLYVPVVTLSTENDKFFLEQLKSGFITTIKWNKYRPQMSAQSILNCSKQLK